MSIAQIAHELRTPINSIISSNELLRNEREYLNEETSGLLSQ